MRTRLTTLALAAVAALLPTAAARAQASNPPYLSQVPAAERVRAEIKGDDSPETAARQMSAFRQLWTDAANTETAPQGQQGGTAFAARVDGLLRQSGYDYRQVKANSWYVNMSGKQLTHIRVLVGAGPDSIAVGAVVVPKRSLRVTADSMYKMMKLSYAFNYVRVCIDPDDDLLVMSQLKGGWLDLQEFKSTVERVAAAADRAYGEVRPFLTAP